MTTCLSRERAGYRGSPEAVGNFLGTVLAQALRLAGTEPKVLVHALVPLARTGAEQAEVGQPLSAKRLPACYRERLAATTLGEASTHPDSEDADLPLPLHREKQARG